MHTWYLRIIDSNGSPSPPRTPRRRGIYGYTVEGMEVEFDGADHHVSDFDCWGTYQTFAEAAARVDEVVRNYHKAEHWDGFSQWIYDKSVV